MKVTFISFTTKRGGAAKALVRIINSVKSNGVLVESIAIEGGDSDIPLWPKLKHKILWVASHAIGKIEKNKYRQKLSLNIFGSKYIKSKILKADLVHLNWINNETLAIKDFYLLSGKAVITLHDEWFYCGIEHHDYDGVYTHEQSKKERRALSLSSFIFRYKLEHYKNLSDVIFTVPSEWMKERAKRSKLLKEHDVRVVPNPININVFKKSTSLQFEWLRNEQDFIITFGAIKGGASMVKGYDLLLEALEIFSDLVNRDKRVKVLTFGGDKSKGKKIAGFELIELGHIEDETEVANVYSASTITVVPSRAESFGQVAAESLSCETPVLAFRYSGLKDIVHHKKSGYLAEPFCAHSLAEGLFWLFDQSRESIHKQGKFGREHIKNSFSSEAVGRLFSRLYQEIGN